VLSGIESLTSLQAGQPDIPTLGKKDVKIAPEGFHDIMPEEGITIGFGEGIAEEVRKIVEEKCNDGKDFQGCIGAVHEAITKTDLNTHTKRFVLLTAGTVALAMPWLAVIVVVAAIGISLWAGSNTPAKVHLPHEDDGPLAQIQTLGDDVSEITFAMGDKDEAEVVATVTITPTPAPAPSSV
jgi:hypothetical protein